ncbi:MAG: cytochrome b N-terminal domain-containing protein [Thermaerobacterales bacterium]
MSDQEGERPDQQDQPEGQPKQPLFDRFWSAFRKTDFFKSVWKDDYPHDKRTQVFAVFNNLFLHLQPNTVSRYSLYFRYTFGLGGLSFAMFLILSITGVFLMFYYIPAVPEAYFSVRALETDIFMGLFFRNMHRWAAHLMVLLVFLHMLRVFYTGSYKDTRKFNWVIGVGLFVLTLLLSFTGYLLPWDGLAFWAVMVGIQIGAVSPLIGDQVRLLMIGGHELGTHTLIRWYTVHVLFLPAIAFWLMLLHFWRVRKDNFSATKPIPAEEHPYLPMPRQRRQREE